MMNRAQATLLPDMRHTWAVSQLCGQRSSHPQHEATPCLGTTALHKEAGELDTSWQPRGAHVPTGWAQGVGIRAESECPGPRPPLSLTTCDNSGVSGPGAGRLESRLSPMAGCQGTQAAMDSADRPQPSTCTPLFRYLSRTHVSPLPAPLGLWGCPCRNACPCPELRALRICRERRPAPCMQRGLSAQPPGPAPPPQPGQTGCSGDKPQGEAACSRVQPAVP